MTKEERYEELERKKEICEEALDYAQSLHDVLESAEVSGLKRIYSKASYIVEDLEQKIERTEEYLDNIEL